MLRTIKQHPLYVEQRLLLVGIPRFFVVEDAVDWAIARAPEMWPIIPGAGEIRVLRTDGMDSGEWTVEGWPPIFRVAYRIVDDETVELLSIQLAKKDD